ncbi:MAG: 3-isopropylmalate dehydratase, small subunit [SAR86 cluster bacterium SAR86B]|uniref:3-isopropylmalate dehydratase small subunit n=1 Tax=SAR86 cluster bacterium SAR86B TaxID=1123867 RepID=J4V2X9_9GAMM|nr:MAG: 3-isopropylmalate dehydratase, small subunit [SAR86 cluster bacterium SAR86B]
MNEKITDFQGVVAHIDRNNIDTDQIIPTEYLKSIKKYGYEDYLFDGWRYSDTGRLGQKKETRALIDDFILNQEIYSKSTILLTRDNFGCGSSREHAVWALRDFGIKAVIASSFGDIFYNNCFKNGVLPIVLNAYVIETLFNDAFNSLLELSISLEEKTIRSADGDLISSFKVDQGLLDRIIFNLDDVDITLKDADEIKSFESMRKELRPEIFKDV